MPLVVDIAEGYGDPARRTGVGESAGPATKAPLVIVLLVAGAAAVLGAVSLNAQGTQEVRSTIQQDTSRFIANPVQEPIVDARQAAPSPNATICCESPFLLSWAKVCSSVPIPGDGSSPCSDGRPVTQAPIASLMLCLIAFILLAGGMATDTLGVLFFVGTLLVAVLAVRIFMGAAMYIGLYFMGP
jgi:UPF0716 family protein affecting phage T7 exclusion